MTVVTEFLDTCKQSEWFDENLPSTFYSSDAINIMLTRVDFKPEEDQLIVRLVSLALYIEQGFDITEQANPYTIEEADTNSLDEIIGYPDQTDLVKFLLASKPSIDDWEGEYVASYQRDDTRIALLTERRTIFGDSSQCSKSTKLLDKSVDIYPNVTGILGSTRRYSLTALNSTIVAAKIAGCMERCESPELKWHFEILLYLYLNIISRVDRRSTGYLAIAKFVYLRSCLLTIKERNTTEESVLKYVQLTLPPMHFHIKRFDRARDLYLENSGDESLSLDNRNHALWASHICLLGARNSDAFLTSIQATEEELPQELNEVNECIANILNYGVEELLHDENCASIVDVYRQKSDWQYVDSSFRSVFKSLALYIEAINHFLLRFKFSADIKLGNEYTAEGKVVIQELLAYLRDCFYLINFNLNEYGEWECYSAKGIVHIEDFLHHMDRNGNHAEAGAVEQHSTHPYGMSDPEEDLATFLHAYGHDLGDHKGRNISQWVQSRFDAAGSDSSLRPFVKLVWAEWFGLAFNTTDGLTVDLSSFKYTVLNNSGMTSMEQVVEKIGNSAGETHLVKMLTTFLHARQLLEEKFP